MLKLVESKVTLGTYEQDDESDKQNIEGRNSYGTEFAGKKGSTRPMD